MIKLKLSRNTKILLCLLSLIFIVKLITLLSFNNIEWEPDSYMHFLELRTIYADFPNNLNLGLNVWSKPLYIYPLGLIVQIFNIKSFLAIEIVNTLIFLFISFLIYRILLILYKSFTLAILGLLLTSFSLTLFKSSVSVLTEPVFTLTLVSSFYFLTLKKYKLASLLIGLSVLARIEGLFFMGLYFLYLCIEFKFNIKKLIINALIIAIPFATWNLVGFITTGNILYFRTFFQSYSSGDYGKGSLLDYPKLFATKEFLLSILFVISTIVLIKFRKNFENLKLVIYSFLIFFLFVLVQAILWSRGAFGTAGLMRYFISVIPFMIIFTISIFIYLKGKMRVGYYRVVLILVASSQLLLTFSYVNGFIVRTKEFPKVESEFIQAGLWAKQNVNYQTFLAADRPEILYYSERDLTNSKVYFSEEFNNNKKGIYIWTEWSPITNKITQSDIIQNSQLLTSFNGKVFIYEIK